MKTIAKNGTALALIHLAVNILHGMSHTSLHIGITALQKFFVLTVILVLPLVAAVLLWTPVARAGLVLMALSMGAAFLFGAWNHFAVMGPDNVLEAGSGGMGRLFQASAVLLALIEAAGCWLGLVWLRRASL